jgi:hypothetical protein
MGFERIEYVTRAMNVKPGTRVSQSLNQLAASVASTDMRKYLKAIVFAVRGRIVGSGEGAQDIGAFASMGIAGKVTLSHKGGYLAQSLDCRDLHASNMCEGFWPLDKRNAAFSGPLMVDSPTPLAHDFVYTGVLAYAPPSVSNDLRAAKSFDGAMPVSMLGQHSTFTLDLGKLPSGWVFENEEEGFFVSVVAILHTSREKYAPRPSEIRAQDYTSDPLTLDGELQKLYSLVLMLASYKQPSSGDWPLATPVIKCDELAITDTAAFMEYMWARLTERNDASSYGPGTDLEGLMFPLIDPFMSDRLSEMHGGNKWTIDNLRGPFKADLKVVYRRLTKLSASDFASWAALEGLGSVDRMRLRVGGKSKDQLSLTSVELLGLPVSVDSEKKS